MYILEVLSQEAGIDLLECLSTVAAQQTADCTTNGRLLHKGMGTSPMRFG